MIEELGHDIQRLLDPAEIGEIKDEESEFDRVVSITSTTNNRAILIQITAGKEQDKGEDGNETDGYKWPCSEIAR